MIHIGTLHTGDPRWIDIQLASIRRHTSEPYRTYASLAGIDPAQAAKFDHAIDHTGRVTARKGEGLGIRLSECVDRLSDEMTSRAEPDDLLVFMHSDTLAIADWVGPVREMLRTHPLAAVRRDENGEPIPHWCFCVTTAGFWREIGGNWWYGPTFNCLGRELTDMGAQLWQDLERRGIEWRPILRTNEIDLHPVFFGVYGDLVYHHGAGSHPAMTARDASEYWDRPVPLRNLAGVRKRIQNGILARKVFRRIRRGDDVYLELTGAKPA
jgi:hypothetical protein